MRSKLYPSEYLAVLTIKHEVDADNLFDALVSAGTNGKSECGNLAIVCRSKVGGRAIFLITENSKVVAQFHLPSEFLLSTTNPIKAARAARLRDVKSQKKFGTQQSFQIKDLRVGMKNVNLKAKVTEVSKPTSVITRFGNCANVANAMVSDDTGNIKLCLWNDQIGSVTVGDNLEIQNAKISTFKNERQMRVGKKGILRVA
jgi:replication factor A1